MALLDKGLKQRMVGALVLLALAVIFLPMLLSREDELRRVVVDAPSMPDAPAMPQIEMQPVVVPEPQPLADELPVAGDDVQAPEPSAVPEAVPAPTPAAKPVAPAVAQVGLPCVVKTADFGYDGKGQMKLTTAADLEQAVAIFRGRRCVVEAWCEFTCELSVIVARSSAGETRAFPVAENIHTHHILDFSIVPARVTARCRISMAS